MKKEFNYYLGEKEYIDFQLNFLNPTIKKQMKTTILILIAIYILIFSIMFFYVGKNINTTITVFAIVTFFSILQIITYKVRLEKSIIKKLKKYIKLGKINNILGDKTLKIIDDNNISLIDKEKEMSYNKKDITKITQSKKCIFLYTDDISAIIIPKNILNNDELLFLKNFFY